MGFYRSGDTLGGPNETIVDLTVEKGEVEKCHLKNIAEGVPRTSKWCVACYEPRKAREKMECPRGLPKEYDLCYECSGTAKEAKERACKRFWIFKSVEPMTYVERMRELGWVG